MSTLKWKKREEGYIMKTPADILMMTPASHITSQDLSVLLNWPRPWSEFEYNHVPSAHLP